MGSERHTSGNGEPIADIRQMLGELYQVASKEGANMLCYLIEMAYAEPVTCSARPAPSLSQPRK